MGSDCGEFTGNRLGIDEQGRRCAAAELTAGSGAEGSSASGGFDFDEKPGPAKIKAVVVRRGGADEAVGGISVKGDGETAGAPRDRDVINEMFQRDRFLFRWEGDETA